MEAQREREECIWERARKTYLLLLVLERSRFPQKLCTYMGLRKTSLPDELHLSGAGGGRDVRAATFK